MVLLADNLRADHGDIETVIPALVSRKGVRQAAKELQVSRRWLEDWLKANGYVCVRQWVKSDSIARL